MKFMLTIFTYGPEEKRTEIEVRPTIPESIRGDVPKIQEWIRALTQSMGADVKFTNEWECEICSKPARETKHELLDWSHLDPPRAVLYVHHLCAAGINPCHMIIKAQTAAVLQRVDLSNAHLDFIRPEVPYPLASSCAKCNDEKTARKGYKMSRCSGCKLTRYCCPGCQKADWPRHKKACKIIESVNWVNWPAK